MRESVFQGEIKKSIEKHGGWCEKFPDMPNFGKASRFVPIKPFDLIAVINGRPLAIECKMLPRVMAFNMKKISSGQLASLLEFKHTGKGKSFVFLNVRNVKPGERVNELFIFEIGQLMLLWQMYDGSIKKDHFEMFDAIPGEKGLFDLSGFLREHCAV